MGGFMCFCLFVLFSLLFSGEGKEIFIYVIG